MSERKKVLYEYLSALTIAMIAALFIRIFIIQAFRIPTGSMKDTLLVGDFILVSKFEYGVKFPDTLPGTNLSLPAFRFPRFRHPQRGDVIVFKYPKDKSVDYIKRCVGLPGDTIIIRNNRVTINGEPEGVRHFVSDTFDIQDHQQIATFMIETPETSYTIRKQVNGRSRMDSYGPVVVPPDHYFMMGDNRDNSYDSRYWGFLPRDCIIGRALVIYFSINQSAYDAPQHLITAVRWRRLFKRIR